jgi:hypothetical protein
MIFVDELFFCVTTMESDLSCFDSMISLFLDRSASVHRWIPHILRDNSCTALVVARHDQTPARGVRHDSFVNKRIAFAQFTQFAPVSDLKPYAINEIA